MAKKASDLHFGDLLDVDDVPMFLKGPGLKAHTLVVGQSGSGKSFMLGRLLEEIASRTDARIVIFDPNSDFIRFSEINDDAWVRHKEGFRAPDTASAFHKSWDDISLVLLTARSQGDLGLKNAKNVTVAHPRLPWIPETLAAAVELGFDPKVDVRELFVLNSIFSDDKKEIELFKGFYKRAEDEWEKAKTGSTYKESASKVYSRAHLLESLNVWATKADQPTVRTYIRHMFDGTSKSRILCLDLASLAKQEERLVVSNAALDELWTSTRRAWLDAIKEQGKEDSRRPVFIVIDEAHNLAPGSAAPGLTSTVRDMLTRIATEGRKYGLFLLMVTQRPSRLEETIRSQCDNLCLLKMNDRHDLLLVENSFGFIPEGWARRALDFKKGDVLLAGSLAERAVFAHAAPRRTVEGGQNLRDEAWLPYLR